jgi:hypothetical protein
VEGEGVVLANAFAGCGTQLELLWVGAQTVSEGAGPESATLMMLP